MGPLVLVEWVDSSRQEAGWTLFREWEIVPIMPCFSVGWLVHRDKDSVIVCSNVGDLDSPNAQGTCYMQIPQVAIRRLVRLGETRGKVPPQVKLPG